MSRRKIKEWGGSSLAELQARWERESIFLYGSIDSTNEAARELAAEGAPGGTIVLCREQTAGRGRAGHAWHSPKDSGLYLSLILRPTDLSHPPLVSLLAGLGIVERLEVDFPGLAPGLKWPNDLVAAGLKLGGILAEATWVEARPEHLVIGVGVNVRPLDSSAPGEIVGRATAMESVLGESVRLREVADAVITGLESRLARIPPALDADLLSRVDRYDWLRDRRARLTLPGQDEGLAGACVGIAPDGALLFRPDRGALRRVTDGVVDPWA